MKRQAVVLGVLGSSRLRGARRCIVLCEYRVDDGTEHHGDHEGRKDVAEREGAGERGVARFLEGRHPKEDEEIHRAFEAGLRQAESEEDGV